MTAARRTFPHTLTSALLRSAWADTLEARSLGRGAGAEWTRGPRRQVLSRRLADVCTFSSHPEHSITHPRFYFGAWPHSSPLRAFVTRYLGPSVSWFRARKTVP